uniref:Uncharacterized protein n=1 Tax=Hyaloperonospora arabidopsidis (strain Emoy2) TaxID=559515 RepID=M4BUZ6_HYAAE
MAQKFAGNWPSVPKTNTAVDDTVAKWGFKKRLKHVEQKQSYWGNVDPLDRMTTAK